MSDISFNIYEIHTNSSAAGGPGDYLVLKNITSSDLSGSDISVNINSTHQFDLPIIDIPANGYWLGFHDVSTSYTFDSSFDFVNRISSSPDDVSFNLSDTEVGNVSITYKGSGRNDVSFNGGYIYAQRYPEMSTDASSSGISDISYAFHLRFKNSSNAIIDISSESVFPVDISKVEFGSTYIHQLIQDPGNSRLMSEVRNDGSANYYIKNDGTNSAGYVFEFTPLEMDKTLDVSPAFEETVTIIDGLSADAVAEIDVSLTQFNKFFVFRVDAIDISDGLASTLDGSGDVLIGISGESTGTNGLLKDISYSNADVITHSIIPSTTEYENKTIEYDYVRHLSKEITGGYAAVDIFSNEEALRNEVRSSDTTIRSNFDSKLLDTNGFTIRDISLTDISYAGVTTSIYKTLKNLFNLNLNTTDSTRLQNQTQILSDITSATVINSDTNRPYKIVPLKFSQNDRVVLKVNYKQSNTNPIGTNTISDRSYKILLKLV